MINIWILGSTEKPATQEEIDKLKEELSRLGGE